LVCKNARESKNRALAEKAVGDIIKQLQADSELDLHVSANFFTDGIGWLFVATDYNNRYTPQDAFQTLINEFNTERKVVHVDELYYKKFSKNHTKENKMETNNKTNVDLDKKLNEQNEQMLNRFKELFGAYDKKLDKALSELDKATAEMEKASEQSKSQNNPNAECGIGCFISKNSDTIVYTGLAIGVIGLGAYAYNKYYKQDT
jgi:hypothetical protein